MTDASARWVSEGERLFRSAVARLPAEDLDGPSRLPGWARRHVIGHVARNADALVNLLVWAETGIETPMYSSPAEREQSILRAASQAPRELVADCLAASDRFELAIAAMRADAWRATVRTAQGRLVPAREVLWMRAREVWVHSVDLSAGVGFASFPADLLRALARDVLAAWERRGLDRPVVLSDSGLQWRTGNEISAPLPQVVAWMTGRPDSAGLPGAPASQAAPWI